LKYRTDVKFVHEVQLVESGPKHERQIGLQGEQILFEEMLCGKVPIAQV
jgi:hypothetical protein